MAEEAFYPMVTEACTTTLIMESALEMVEPEDRGIARPQPVASAEGAGITSTIPAEVGAADTRAEVVAEITTHPPTPEAAGVPSIPVTTRTTQQAPTPATAAWSSSILSLRARHSI